MTSGTFESMLSGGHPNSLGRTLEVVQIILSEPDKLDELYSCYSSSDEVVRLRTSSVFKKYQRNILIGWRHLLMRYPILIKPQLNGR